MPVDYLSGLGKLPDPMGDINRAINMRLGQDQAALQNQQMQMQMTAAQAKAERVRAFETNAAAALQNPTAGAISDLIIKNPEYAEQIKKGWDIREDAVRQTDLTQLGEIFSAGSSGRFDLAAKAARRRYDADLAAGQADEGDLALVTALESEDPAQQKAALGMIGVNLAAATGPTHFGTVYGALNKDKEGFSLSQGQKRFDAEGNVIAEVAPETEYLIIPEGGKAIPKGEAGGGASVPSGAVGNLAGPQATVASTLAGANMPPAVVAGFLGNFEVEGGFNGAKGDGGTAHGIAQWRGERQTNFKRVIGKPVGEASHAEQARFVAWEMNNPEAAGMTVAQRDQILAAKSPGQAAALIDKFYERSSGEHRSRRVAAAGRFAGAVSGGSAPASGDPAGTLYGAPKARPGRMTPAEVASEGLDPKVVYYRNADGVPTAVSGQEKPRSAALPKVPAATMAGFIENNKGIRGIEETIKQINQNPTAVGAWNKFTPDFIASRWDPKGVNARAGLTDVGSLILHNRSGATVTIAETPRLLPFIPQKDDDAPTAIKKLRRLGQELAMMNQDMVDAYSNEEGDSQLLRIGRSRGAPVGGIVKVPSIQAAQKLPKGTRVQTPDGRTGWVK